MRFLADKSGQGEGLIKMLVVAIIAIIAIALAKSYFQEAAKTTHATAEEVFSPSEGLDLAEARMPVKLDYFPSPSS